MSKLPFFRTRARTFVSLIVAAVFTLLPVGCSMLEQKERELVFRIEPGTA
ncbi:MAG TPA: alpha/beta hydrolase, partial [Pseudomonas sp.]|nr:alpha/beta hydrolase [Pseudomonas sp.]